MIGLTNNGGTKMREYKTWNEYCKEELTDEDFEDENV